MFETAWKLAEENNLPAALQWLAGQTDATEALKAFGQMTVKLYWEKKDLPASVQTALTGIDYGFLATEPEHDRDEQEETEILSQVKGLFYNLASFTWPGWDEPGIVIDNELQEIGLEAARTNLSLAEDLEKGHLALSRAHWVLGAHFLAAAQLEAALENFASAADFAIESGSRDEELLALGFASLAALKSDADNEAALAQLQTIRAELAAREGGAGFIEQIETAGRVFGIPAKR